MLGEQIGRGGFGQVYVATGVTDGSVAVVKLVPKEPGAERELLFIDLSGVRNVVPIIDSGETTDHYVLVMPRAEKSLRRHLEDAGGRLDVAAAVAVLTDIATALADLDGRVVHRDLKPENVLFLGDRWCLADFGISRYAEATTAPDTQKYALSPPYAAPERWRNERATIATDVYALGVMAYEMLAGSRPFSGPNRHDFRDQHLHHDPASLECVPTVLAALVEECLYKAPETRPRPSNIAARLGRAVEPALTGVALPDSSRLAKRKRCGAARLHVRRRSSSPRRSDEQHCSRQRAKACSASVTDLSRRSSISHRPPSCPLVRVAGLFSLMRLHCGSSRPWPLGLIRGA
jgi:eukaryotic-like serine/threonine-protein kinase